MRLVLTFLSICGSCVSSPAIAEDQTIAEFRKYAAQKLTGLSEARLDAIVSRVDANSDGMISDAEFAKRLAVFREVKSGPEPWMSDLKKARATAKRLGKPLLIFARADWCPVCRQVEQKTLPDPGVERQLRDFVLLKVNVDKDKETTDELVIAATPTFLIEDGHDVRIAKQLGGPDPRPMADWLSEVQLTFAAADAARKARTLRVLSYNIHHGAGVDGKLDLQRIASVIIQSKADIVALQEVDRATSRTGKVDQAAELARLTKMNVRFGGNIKFGGGDYGNAVLSKFRIKLRKNHALPNIQNGEQRGVLDVDLETKAGPMRMLATHFDHRRPNEERIASAEFVNKLLAAEPKTLTLLAGDLNATPDSETLKILAPNWQLPTRRFPTVPVGNPARQIDYVLAARANRLKLVETKVLSEAVASDHLAILTVIEVLPSEAENEQKERRRGLPESFQRALESIPADKVERAPI